MDEDKAKDQEYTSKIKSLKTKVMEIGLMYEL